MLAGLDCATTSGLALMSGGKIVRAEAFKATGETDAEVFTSFRKWLRATLRDNGVKNLAIEQPLVTDIRATDRRQGAQPGDTHNPVTFKTYLRLYGLRAHAIQIADALEIAWVEVHQSSWRKSFTGNGRASKDETLALARQIVPGLKSKDAAEAIGIVWHLAGALKQASMARPGDLFAGAA